MLNPGNNYTFNMNSCEKFIFDTGVGGWGVTFIFMWHYEQISQQINCNLQCLLTSNGSVKGPLPLASWVCVRQLFGFCALESIDAKLKDTKMQREGVAL